MKQKIDRKAKRNSEGVKMKMKLQMKRKFETIQKRKELITNKRGMDCAWHFFVSTIHGS